MEKLKRDDKIYLDIDKKKESQVNRYLDCRDGIVEGYEYNDESGYGLKTRLFLCEDSKNEITSIVRQTYSGVNKEWYEESMYFDTDSFAFLKAIINGKKDELGGEYFKIRYFTE